MQVLTRGTSIKSMAGLLHPPSAKARIIVALRAYFDESGTHWSRANRDSPAPGSCEDFVLCGYIAPESLWDDKSDESFVARWTDVMHGKPFHATDMEKNPQGPTVKPLLAKIANSSGIIGVGGGISIPAFNKFLLPYIKQNGGVEDPYLFLFGDVICEAVLRASMFLEDKSEPIGFVFAKHERWSIIAHEMYDNLKADPNTPEDVKIRMGSVAFDDVNQFVPLQAADHLAYETFHAMTDPPNTLRPALNIFTDWPQNHGRYWDEKGIKDYILKMIKEGLFSAPKG